jgi:ribonuclease HI
MAERLWAYGAYSSETNTRLPTPAKIVTSVPEIISSISGAVVHCDGSWDPRSGYGGWGAIIDHAGKRRELHGGARDTSNNRMELQGAISALEALPPGCVVRVISDSQYLIKGARDWLDGWKRKGRLGKMLNSDLWQRVDELRSTRTVAWEWCRGHSHNMRNRRADHLATLGRLHAERTASE